jgi:hypothetical protein
MRRQIVRGKLRVAIARALALAGAAIALTCGGLFFLAGAATPAAAACGDGVTYQAGMAAGGCPDTGAGKAVGVAAGVAGGAAAAMVARVLVRSVASGDDLDAVERELVSVELVSREGAAVQRAYPGAADLAGLGAQLEAADEYGEGAESNEWREEAFDSADITETVAKGGIEAGKTEEEPAEPASTSQVAITSVNPYPIVYTTAEPDLINPIRDITMLIVAGHQAVVWVKEGKPWLRGGHGE